MSELEPKSGSVMGPAVFRMCAGVAAFGLILYGVGRAVMIAVHAFQLRSGGNVYEWYAFHNRATGPYWWAFWGVVVWPFPVAGLLLAARWFAREGSDR